MLNVWIFTMKIAAYDTGRGASVLVSARSQIITDSTIDAGAQGRCSNKCRGSLLENLHYLSQSRPGI